jgi:hypothetical protein
MRDNSASPSLPRAPAFPRVDMEHQNAFTHHSTPPCSPSLAPALRPTRRGRHGRTPEVAAALLVPTAAFGHSPSRARHCPCLTFLPPLRVLAHARAAGNHRRHHAATAMAITCMARPPRTLSRPPTTTSECARTPACLPATSPTPTCPPPAGAVSSVELLCLNSRQGPRA